VPDFATRFTPLRSIDDLEISTSLLNEFSHFAVTANNEEGMWRGHMIITWYAGKFALHDEVCFTTEMEAENHVIELGKHWVNNRLQGMQG
jgi:hypothetical protein